MINAIDAYLLSKMQKFTDWIQRVFGIVKFDIHKWVVILRSVAYWMFAFATFVPVLLLVSLLMSFFAMRKVWLLELDKRNWLEGRLAIRHSGAHDGSIRQSVLIVQGVIFFIMCATFLLPPSVARFWLAMWCLLDVVNVYLAACTPKPPGKSTARELYEKLLIRLNNALEPAPVCRVPPGG